MTMQYRGLTLDPFQEQAIGHLADGRSVLVCAPTGTGKTVIADWIVEQALQRGKHVVYTAPVKALSNQKYRDWVALYGEANVGLVTGDLVIRRDAPCLVMTTEILRNMLLTEGCPPDLLAVVLDEIHFLDDKERGTVWEEVLIYLPPEVQIVGLSATLSNLDDFAAWLESVRRRPVGVVVEERRAVPLELVYASVETGLCTPEAYVSKARKASAKWAEPRARGRDRGRGRGADTGRHRGQSTRPYDLHRMAVDAELLPYLFFVFSRRDTERYAFALADRLDRPLVDVEEREQIEARLVEFQRQYPRIIDRDLARVYAEGIAFHHAGLHVQLKSLVEKLYEERLIKALFCTSTFALGVNLPARAVLFGAIEKFDGQKTSPLTTRQFLQKAGRAGRRGLDAFGTVVIKVDPSEFEYMKPHLERFRKAEPEPVRSSFNLSFNSVIRLLEQHDEATIQKLLARSFLAWHLDRKQKVDDKRVAALRAHVGKDPAAAKELKLIEKRAAKTPGVWEQFRNKVIYLESVGYLDQEHQFNAGARVLRHLQINEVLVTELVLQGVLEDVDDDSLFGLLCAITSELPRQAGYRPAISKDDRALLIKVRAVLTGPVVANAHELAGGEQPFGPEMLPIGRLWAQGKSLAFIMGDIASDTDLSGDIVTSFRRAKDLVSQLADVFAEDKPRSDALRKLVRRIARDEVEVIG
jgi:superfamily II RNA helicase